MKNGFVSFCYVGEVEITMNIKNSLSLIKYATLKSQAKLNLQFTKDLKLNILVHKIIEVNLNIVLISYGYNDSKIDKLT